MARNSDSGWSRKWSAFFALIIILGGVAVSLGFAVRLRSALQRNADTRMINTSETLQNTVNDQLSAYIDTVRSSAAGLTALHTPTKGGFTEITTAIEAQKLPAVSAVRFLVPASPEELGTVEPTWRPRGADGLTITPVKGAQQHFFTVFARGLNGVKAPALGVDQVAAPAEVEVARLARTTDNVAISDAYVLLSDEKLAKAEQQLSFDVVAPVYGGSNRALTGYLALSIRGTEFLTSSLSAASGGLLDAELLTRSASGMLAQVARVSENRAEDVRRAQDFVAGHRQWVLRTTTSNRELLPNAGRTDMAVLLAGSVLAVMFGTLMYLQMSATARTDEEIELEVAERLIAAGLPVPKRKRDDDDDEDDLDEDAPVAAGVDVAEPESATTEEADEPGPPVTTSEDSPEPVILEGELGAEPSEEAAAAAPASPTAPADSAAPAAPETAASEADVVESVGVESAVVESAAPEAEVVDAVVVDAVVVESVVVEGVLEIESQAEAPDDEPGPAPAEGQQIVTIEGELVSEPLTQPADETSTSDSQDQQAPEQAPELAPAPDPAPPSADVRPTRRAGRNQRTTAAEGRQEPAAKPKAVRGRRPRKMSQPPAIVADPGESTPRTTTARPRRNTKSGHAEAGNVAENLRHETGQTDNPMVHRPS